MIKNEVITERISYEIRKSTDLEVVVKKGNRSKFDRWEDAWDYVMCDLCDVQKPEYHDPSEYVIVEVKTTVSIFSRL